MAERTPQQDVEAPRPRSRRLGRRLLSWFLLISLVPLLTSNGLGYLRSEVIIEGLVRRYLAGIADLQARHVGARLEDLARGLREIGSRDIIRRSALSDTVPRALDDRLLSAMDDYPEFDAVYLFDERGDLLAAAPLSPADVGMWIGPPLEPPFEPFEVRRAPQPPRYPYVRLSTPLGGSGGAPERYLGATVSLAGGRPFLELPPHTAGSVETIVVDEDGAPVFVSHPHGHLDYGAPFGSPLIGAESGAYALYTDRLDVPVLGTVVEVPGQPWQLIEEVPVADALRELRELRAISLWLGSVLALVVLATAWVIAGRVVAPVSRLVSATRGLGAGDLTVRVDPSGQDEIGELGSSFNRMAAQLEETSALADELHRKELERAGQLATVGELAAGVAHEIKNPIAGISGGMDLIARRVPDDPELRQITDEMRRQTARIDVAVRDLLSFARPVKPTLVATDLNEVAARAMTLTTPAAEGSSVTMEQGLSPALPSIRADAHLLGQCLVNLLINAIQASEEGGRVLVETKAVEDGVAVSVSDSGPGIPPDQIARIFRPFVTTKHQGTGLGLSITAGIVARHGGRITVDSPAGGGATFTIWLPLDASTSRSDEVTDASPEREA